MSDPRFDSDVYPYTYHWQRQDRKGQSCRVIARGTLNSICVEFRDGYRMVTSGNSIRKIKETANA